MSNDYSSLKVVDLKKELKTRGLSTSGNKDELVERLNTYTQNLLGNGSDIDGFGESIAENDILDEDVLGEELDYEEDVLKKSGDLGFSSPNENSALDIPADISVDSNNSCLDVTVIAANDEKPLPQRETQRKTQKTEKKVHLIRNRSIAVLSDTDLKENSKLENNKEENKQTKSSESKAIVKTKLSQSMEERLKQRKRKFGSFQEEDKKMLRAARFGLNNDSSAKSSISKKMTESRDVLKQRAERFGLSSSTPIDKNKTLQALKNRAERFGSVVSPLLNKLSEEEKMQARKNRFLLSTSNTNVSSLEEKKKLRAQRFNIAT